MNVFTSILLILLGAGLGYFGNRYANKQSEDRIIAAFIKEIESLKNKEQIARLTPEELKYKQDIEAQLYLLKNWEKF